MEWSRRAALTPSDADDLFAVQMLRAYGTSGGELKSSIEEPRLSTISSASQARDALMQFIKNVGNAEVGGHFASAASGTIS